MITKLLKDIKVLENRMDLMSTTQERQREQIRGYQKTQSELLDEIVKTEQRLDVALNIMENESHNLVKEYESKCEERRL